MTRNIGVIGVPMDLGGSQRGVDMGPSAIRLSGFEDELRAMGCDVRDYGNVMVRTRQLVEADAADARHLREIMRACRSAAEMTTEVLEDGRVPLLLGGDHSIALGPLWGMARQHGPGGAIWIDAHADLNTPATTASGNVHGMVLAIALGLCADDERFRSEKVPQCAVDVRHAVIVGARDLDPPEQAILRSGEGPTIFTMSDIDRRGIEAVMADALEVAHGAPFVHVSLDMDSVDPRDAPGVGTPVRGGLTYRESHTVMELISDASFDSMDINEVNPVLDANNATAQLAGELALSAFGSRIL